MNAVVKPEALAKPDPETIDNPVASNVAEPEQHASSAALLPELRAAQQELYDLNGEFADAALALAENRAGAQDQFTELQAKRAHLAERVDLLTAAHARAERHERYAAAHAEYAIVEKNGQKAGGFLRRRNEMLNDCAKHLALAGKAFKEAIRCAESAPTFGGRVNLDALLTASQIRHAVKVEMYRTCGDHRPLSNGTLALPGAEPLGMGTLNPDTIQPLTERALQDYKYVKAQFEGKLKELAAGLKQIEAPEQVTNDAASAGLEGIATR